MTERRTFAKPENTVVITTSKKRYYAEKTTPLGLNKGSGPIVELAQYIEGLKINGFVEQ